MEARDLIRNAMDLPLETLAPEDMDVILTRAEAAKLLYEASLLAREAPGLRTVRQR